MHRQFERSARTSPIRQPVVSIRSVTSAMTIGGWGRDGGWSPSAERRL